VVSLLDLNFLKQCPSESTLHTGPGPDTGPGAGPDGLGLGLDTVTTAALPKLDMPFPMIDREAVSVDVMSITRGVLFDEIS
jgi:hypothetical protein